MHLLLNSYSIARNFLRISIIILSIPCFFQSSYSQCDINIFRNGSITSGSVTLFPQTNGDMTCKKIENCDDSRALLTWTFDNYEKCDLKNLSSNPSIQDEALEILIDDSIEKSNSVFGIKRGALSNNAIAINDGDKITFSTSLKVGDGDYIGLNNLNYSAKYLVNVNDFYCDMEEGMLDILTSYNLSIWVDGTIAFNENRSIKDTWQFKEVSLKSLRKNMGIRFGDDVNLEIVFTVPKTKNRAFLAIDDMSILGQSCMKDKEVSYAWSTGENTETITFAKAGEYCVTITDCNGCIAEDCISLE